MTDFQWELLKVALWAIASGFAATVATAIWRKAVLPLVKKTRFQLGLRLATAADGPGQWLLVAACLEFGASLAFTSGPTDGPLALFGKGRIWQAIIDTFYVNAVFAATFLAYALSGAAVNWYADAFAQKTKTRIDNSVVILFHRFAKVAFFFFALLIIFRRLNLDITGILTAGGVASLAVAFAARDTLANTISGIILMIDRPFKRGDRITLPSGEWGDVIEIGLRTTKVLSYHQEVIVLPNAEIAKSQIINHSAPDEKIRIEHHLGVAYGSNMRKVKEIIMDILVAHPDIMDDPPQQVYFMEFGDSSLNLTIFFWVQDYRQRWHVIDEINMGINDAFAEQGIEIPFPQRDIHIRSAAPQPPAT
jgi:MscS family membrane protein